MTATALLSLALLFQASTLERQAYQAYQQRDWAAAVRLYEAFHGAAPGTAASYDNLGVALTSLGRWNQAENALRKAIELNPRHRWAYNHLGFVYRELGRYEKAIEMFQRQIDIGPKDPYAYRNLAATLALADRLDEADKAAALYEKYGYERGAAYVDMACNLNSRNRPEQAKTYLDRAAAAGAERSLLAQEKAHYFLTVQDFSAAEEQYLKILEYRPHDSMAALRLGMLYFQAGRLDRSATIFGRVIEVDENDRVTIRTTANHWKTLRLEELRSGAGEAVFGDVPVDLGRAALLVRVDQRHRRYQESNSEQARDRLRTACRELLGAEKKPEVRSWAQNICP